MWPWEHVLVGYLAYSLFSHLFFRESPDGATTGAVVFASLLPDLIDKPLAWQFGVFPSGYALGHSIFFAVPLSLLVGVLAARRGRTRVGIAFGMAYLLHLVADLVPYYFRWGYLPIERVLWPVLVTREPSYGLGEGFLVLFLPYLSQILALEVTPYLLIQVGITAFTLSLWVYDGMPGTGVFVDGVRSALATTEGVEESGR